MSRTPGHHLVTHRRKQHQHCLQAGRSRLQSVLRILFLSGEKEPLPRHLKYSDERRGAGNLCASPD